MFINDAWYVAALPEELDGGKIVSRTILEQKVALFRTETGQYCALHDACKHRQAPLSLGHIVGDTVVCRYHGARYGSDGICTHIPGQAAIPSRARVRSYPVRERHGFVWIWMGEAETAPDDTTFPASLELLAAPGLRTRNGVFEGMQANYRLLNDNLFDITHAEFVHPESFGGEEVRFYRNAQPGTEPIDRGLVYEIKERSIHFTVHADSLGDEGAPLWRVMMAQARSIPAWTDAIDFTMSVNWHAPCYTTFHIYLRPQGQPEAPPVEFHDFHAATPSLAKQSHYFYQVALNYGDDEALVQFKEAVKNIFMQDLVVLQAQQASLGDMDILTVPHTSFSGDRLQLEARKILERILQQQRTTAA